MQSRVCPGGSRHSSLKNVIPRHSTAQHTLVNLARRNHYSPDEERVGSVRTGVRLGKNERLSETNRPQQKSTREARIPPETY